MTDERPANGDDGRAERQALFVDALNLAITRGRMPGAGFGPLTMAAVQVVAAEHPDATAEHIAAAYDAFRQEDR